MPTTQTRDSLANDIWRACDIRRREDNCGGVMEYVEHLAWLLFLRFLIRTERALNAIRQYILDNLDNPARWHLDKYNAQASAPDPLAAELWRVLKEDTS